MHDHSHGSRRLVHVGLAVVVAVLIAVAAVFAGHLAQLPAGVAVAALAVHAVIIAAAAGAVFVAARSHRQARRGNGGRGLTLHAPLAYDFLASLYTLGRESRMRERTLDLAGVTTGERMLDVCCGTGTLALAAQRRIGASGAVHGIDAAAEMIARAQAKATSAPAPTFHVAEAQALPFPDASFDVVTCSLALHHLPTEVRKAAVVEMKRVLKPGGRVLVVEFGTERTASAWLHPLAIIHRQKEKFLDLAVAAMTEAGFVRLERGSLEFADLGFARAVREP